MKLTVICVGIKHPGNLGAIARLCNNYNVKQLISVRPHCEITDEAYERATNGRRYLDNILIVEDLKDALAYVDLSIALTARVGGHNSLSRSTVPIQRISELYSSHEGEIGLIYGRENTGLYNNEVDLCDVLAFIPISSDSPVLNVSHALAVVLWELSRTNSIDQISGQRLMQRDERNIFIEMLENILPHTWIKEDKYYGITRVYQSILGRSYVTRREANALIGTLRGILRSLEGEHPPWDNEHHG